MRLINLISYWANLVRHHFRDTRLGAKRSGSWARVEHAFKAQHPTCAACGTTVRLQIHHCLPFHLHPELELDPNNLITLCMSPKQCHYLLAHGSNFKAFSPTIRIDAAEALADPSKFTELVARAKANRLFE